MSVFYLFLRMFLCCCAPRVGSYLVNVNFFIVSRVWRAESRPPGSSQCCQIGGIFPSFGEIMMLMGKWGIQAHFWGIFICDFGFTRKMGTFHCGAAFPLNLVILEHIKINNMIHNNFNPYSAGVHYCGQLVGGPAARVSTIVDRAFFEVTLSHI